MPKAKVKRKTKKKKTNNSFLNKLGNTPVFIMLLIVIAGVFLVTIISDEINQEEPNYFNGGDIPGNNNQANFETDKIVKFNSSEEFLAYLEEADEMGDYAYAAGMGGRELAMPEAVSSDGLVFNEDTTVKQTNSASPERVSETNVQVAGIDEPDIVKTDGKEIYLSSLYTFYRGIAEPMIDLDGPEMIDTKIAPDYYETPTTKLVNAWPVEDLALDSEIDFNGNLLLHNDTLVVLSGNTLKAYDVSDAKNPTEKWDVKLDNDYYLLNSRLYDGKVYLVARTNINRSRPCPVPIFEGNESVSLACSDIYHPVDPVETDSTFVALTLDANSGELKDKVSFVGSSWSSMLYMSTEALYVTYAHNTSMFDFMYGFLTSKAADLMPAELSQRLAKLNSYDLGSRAKMVELEEIMDEWINSIDDDEALRLDSEMENRMVEYFDQNKRSLYTTGIVKIDLDNLDVKANGNIPGTPLNQFALDEYDGYLRVATTVGERGGWAMGMSFGREQSANDVYVLDKNLNISGAIQDLGLGERIYSARFVGDKGYLVTFRQIDPFYILDLSNPGKPRMTGELKIPGYSSYLHPISDDKILGIGMEDFRVKISLFDVSDVNNPVEVDKYMLGDYGTETLYNHHAFLLDTKHNIFFLPGSKGGYVFSYENDKLELVRAVSLPGASRALYLEDYLYVIAPDYIAVLDENNWEKVNELEIETNLP